MSLEARHLGMDRGGKSLFRGVDLTIRPGAVIGLLGPNGAGKSTLLRTLAGEFAPDRGQALLDGQPVVDIEPAVLASRRSVMAQASVVMFDFRVAEILDLGWVRGASLSKLERRRVLKRIVSDCEIDHLINRNFRTLSGGEQQRVQFARVQVQISQTESDDSARYLLLDEPTASLDLAHELAVMRMIRQRAQRGAGVLIVLHDINLAARFCDSLVMLWKGRVAASGSPPDVLTEALLSDVYATPIQVEWHRSLERLVVHA